MPKLGLYPSNIDSISPWLSIDYCSEGQALSAKRFFNSAGDSIKYRQDKTMFSITRPASMISQWMIYYRLAAGSLMEHSLGMPFADYLNLMHIFNHEDSTGAIISILMTRALFHRCRLCPHLWPDQRGSERETAISYKSIDEQFLQLCRLYFSLHPPLNQAFCRNKIWVDIIHIKFNILLPSKLFFFLNFNNQYQPFWVLHCDNITLLSDWLTHRMGRDWKSSWFILSDWRIFRISV